MTCTTREPTNLELAREIIANMRCNGHDMTDAQAERHAQQVARSLSADPDFAKFKG